MTYVRVRTLSLVPVKILPSRTRQVHPQVIVCAKVLCRTQIGNVKWHTLTWWVRPGTGPGGCSGAPGRWPDASFDPQTISTSTCCGSRTTRAVWWFERPGEENTKSLQQKQPKSISKNHVNYVKVQNTSREFVTLIKFGRNERWAEKGLPPGYGLFDRLRPLSSGQLYTKSPHRVHLHKLHVIVEITVFF